MKSVLIPYWFCHNPHSEIESDNHWWLSHLNQYDIRIYAGPFVENGSSIAEGRMIVTIKTSALHFDLIEIDERLRQYARIRIEDISLYWHVIEVLGTCRVRGLDRLRCPKICVVGDTHHQNNPISGLYSYLMCEKFTHVCCSHNQYNPFFSGTLGLQAIDFPFTQISVKDSAGTRVEDLAVGTMHYFGTILSKHHIHRSKLVNRLLASETMGDRIEIHKRSSFTDWAKSVNGFHHNLTCSLNGTFSFQTFLPMLGGAIVYTDPISNANWVGAVLENGVNSIVYGNIGDVDRLFGLYSQREDISRSIGRNARSIISEILPTVDIVSREWYSGVPGHRRLTTSYEHRLHMLIEKLRMSDGFGAVEESVKVFERIQELHRRQWDVRVAFIKSSERGVDRETAALKRDVVEAMIGILPRCNSRHISSSEDICGDAEVIVNLE